MQNKWLIIGVIVVIMVALLGWLFIESTKPLPGEKINYNCDKVIDFSKVDTKSVGDKCRMHVPDGTALNYPSNPPTFGPHYSSWITKGFYSEPRADGNLVHSQEHGYVIIWYDCERKVTGYRQQGIVSTVYAQTAMTDGTDGSASATLKQMPKSFSDGSCSSMENQIKDVLQKFGPHKLIAMPRVGMDVPLTLTAWDRIEKLESFNSGKIKAFIDAYRDNGPEQTVEP